MLCNKKVPCTNIFRTLYEILVGHSNTQCTSCSGVRRRLRVAYSMETSTRFPTSFDPTNPLTDTDSCGEVWGRLLHPSTSSDTNKQPYPSLSPHSPFPQNLPQTSPASRSPHRHFHHPYPTRPDVPPGPHIPLRNNFSLCSS